MDRFVTNTSEQHGILTVDPTFNQFYVTRTTYPHLMLGDIATPSLLGLVLIHQRMDFSTLVGFQRRLVTIFAEFRLIYYVS